ncbi:DUF6328 family protein [Streptomyces sp. NBC_01619]|uniref:DUF6328 family protein n=1 Tax=Streptomyces sp. NBC_01619 TaxID=2975901 RepID=UPI002254D5EA|nr:DUF6328 family protein [Streptomyces sp. NBC_01619]MCX4510550.1 DUF6328 family protein [Streptomyces sp. NBC_01619]
MSDDDPRAARDETELERADRNFAELLQELRVIQTGVQILFAFLLTLAFQARFPTLDSFQRGTYVTTLMLAVIAAALFTAPAAVHRGLFRKGAKKEIVAVSSRLSGIGMAVLSLALTSAVLLVVDVVHGTPEGIVAGAATLLVCAGLWGLLPWIMDRHITGDDESSSEPDSKPTSRPDTDQGRGR